jgi:LPXTG-site transpeptidase (sortase) family protein
MFRTIFEHVWAQKMKFFGVFFLIFSVSYLLLVAIDFVPEPKEATETEEVETVEPAVEIEQTATTDPNKLLSPDGEAALPTSMYIKKLDRTITVLNPESRSIAELDQALLSGVVRHPDSAHLAQNGNVFILGHSSYLPQVMNKNFQAFNGIQDLAWGDTIEVTSGSYVSVYEVEKVFKANAADVTVPVAGDEPRLTLATCNSFGSKDDRFIVEAERIEVRAL